MILESDSNKSFRVRGQRTPEGRCLSCAVGISDELVENLDNSTKTRNFNLIASIELEEVQHGKHWQTKLLRRLCGMTRTALVALFSWVLRELLYRS